MDRLNRKIVREETANLEWHNEPDAAEWERFLRRFEHRDHVEWHEINETVPATWTTTAPPRGDLVRVIRDEESQQGTILSIPLVPIGNTSVPATVSSRHFFARVRHDQESLELSFFGL